MPDSTSNSAPFSQPSMGDAESDEFPVHRRVLAKHAGLFLLTALSVFYTGIVGSEAGADLAKHEGSSWWAPFLHRGALFEGFSFAAGLVGFLLVHELAHYVAARYHRVPASLPFFLPLPFLSKFGTLGAVIQMRGTIRSRSALLDIGASGPLAGLVVAIPLYLYGVSHSKVISTIGLEGGELGESLLLKLMDTLVAPKTSATETILLSPLAYAAWGGLFVTMLNLLPLAQLDGGHVAYALFGPRYNRWSLWVHRLLLGFFLAMLAFSLVRAALADVLFAKMGSNVGTALFWFVWFEMLGILGGFAQRSAEDEESGTATVPWSLSPRLRAGATLGLVLYASAARESSSKLVWGAWFVGLFVLLGLEATRGLLRPHTLLEHPPTDPQSEDLSPARKVVAWVTLAFFVLLFLPVPMEF